MKDSCIYEFNNFKEHKGVIITINVILENIKKGKYNIQTWDVEKYYEVE